MRNRLVRLALVLAVVVGMASLGAGFPGEIKSYDKNITFTDGGAQTPGDSAIVTDSFVAAADGYGGVFEVYDRSDGSQLFSKDLNDGSGDDTHTAFQTTDYIYVYDLSGEITKIDKSTWGEVDSVSTSIKPSSDGEGGAMVYRESEGKIWIVRGKDDGSGTKWTKAERFDMNLNSETSFTLSTNIGFSYGDADVSSNYIFVANGASDEGGILRYDRSDGSTTLVDTGGFADIDLNSDGSKMIVGKDVAPQAFLMYDSDLNVLRNESEPDDVYQVHYRGGDTFYYSVRENHIGVYNSKQDSIKQEFTWSTSSDLIANGMAFTEDTMAVRDNGAAFGGGIGLFTVNSLNQAPQFNSSSINPDPPLIGENVSYSAEVYDPDGSIDHTNLTVEYGGSTVVSNEKRTGTTPSWNDIYKPTTGNKWLNATLTTLDDAGATTSTEINRYLEDTPPNIDLTNPENKTYLDYDKPVEFTVTDSDSNSGETYSCDVDGKKTVDVNEGNTYTDNLRYLQLQKQNFTVSCSNGQGGNTSNTFFNTEPFIIQSSSSASTAYETENKIYSTEVKLGDMTENATARLNWNGSNVDTTQYFGGETIETKTFDNDYSIPLQQNNDTDINWSVDVTGDYFTGSVAGGNRGVSSETKNTGNTSQTLFWSYYPLNFTIDKADYLEHDQIQADSWIHNETGKASIQGTTYNNQTSTNNPLNLAKTVAKQSKYTGTSNTVEVSQDQIPLQVVANYTVTFNGDTRSFKQTQDTTLQQMQFQKCSAGGTQALVFDTYNERNLANQVNTNLQLAAQIWNPEDPSFKRSVNFSSENKSSHEFCIEPGDEELVIDNTNKLLQYQGLPERDWALRSYFLINETISNDTTNIDLYTIFRNETSEVAFDVIDNNDQPVSGGITRIQRYFTAQDKYLTVAMIRTGSDGASETFLEVNEIYYRFEVFEKAEELYELVETFPAQIIPQDLQVLLELGDENIPSYYDYVNKFGEAGCVSNATRIDCSYTANNENFDDVTLTVEEVQPIGFNTTCQQSASTVSGTLICGGLNATENKYKYTLETNLANGDTFLLDNGFVGTVNDDYGETGLMMSFLLFVTMAFAGLWKPEAGITLGLIALVLSYSIGFLALTQTALMSILALGAVLVWRMGS